jgi:hypothetical protein
MTKSASLSYAGKNYDLPIEIGTRNETAIDISRLRADDLFARSDRLRAGVWHGI